MSSVPWFITYLYCCIYSSYILHKKLNKILQETDWPFVSVWILKTRYFICCHSFSFAEPLPVIRCHPLSFVIIRCRSLSLVVFCCHLLSLNLSLVVILCHSLSRIGLPCNSSYHSFSFIVPLVVIRCRSLSLDVPLVCLFINDRTNILKNLLKTQTSTSESNFNENFPHNKEW